MNFKLLTLASLLAVSSAHATPTTIDFDTPVNMDITNAYAGLTITKIGSGGTGPVRTWLASDVANPILNITADSGSNILGLQNQAGLSAADSTAIKIVFDTAVSSVSIAAKFVQLNSNAFSSSGLPFLAAYSGDLAIAANFLASDVWNLAGDPCLTNNLCQSQWDTLSLSFGTDSIKSIVLGGNLPSTNDATLRALFDTLSYAAVGGGGGGVPEPSSLMLAGLGGFGLWASRRRRLSVN